MGFFTQLGDLWSPKNNYGFSKSWDYLGSAWGKTTDSMKSVASGLWGLATSPFSDKRSVADSFMQMQYGLTSASRNLGGAALDVVGAVGELPVAKQLIGTAGWVQNEFVKRPLGTGYLMSGDIQRGKASAFDMDAWRQAYDATRFVSTGQAAVYSGMGTAGGDPTGSYDPRKAGMVDEYHNNTALKYSSGTIDALIDVFVDPTAVGGKLAKAAKVRYISNPLRTGAQVEKFTDTAKYEKLRQFIKDAPNPETVRQRAFNSHRGGDKAAALLWDVRGQDDLYDATFNALYGDRESWDYLVANAPRIAEVTGKIYANQTIARSAELGGVSQKATDQVNALRETESQAFVDAIANGNGAWGAARGVLVGQYAPRLTVTSKWRAGVHNWLTFGPSVFRGSPIYPVVSRARYGLPSATFSRFLDVNDVNSVRNFRANMERSPLDRATVEQYVSQYGRASSPESRARIAADAEDAAFKKMAGAHGFTPEQVESTIPVINRWRTANRQVFSTSRRFLSKDALTLYKKYVDAGREGDADNAFFLSEDMASAIARGDQPSEIYHVLDEDGNNVMIPGRFEIDPAKPVALSQTADIVAMQDWRTLDTALWWTRKGPIGEKSYQLLNAGGSLLDMVNQVWKVTALLRPGYVWRMLSDDVMRRGSLYGSGRVLMSSSRGVLNAGENMVNRGRLMRDAVWGDRQSRGLDATEVVSGDADEVTSRWTDLEREPLGGPYAPDPDAMALSAGSDDRLRRAIEVTAGRDSYTKADLRRELNMGDAQANRIIEEMTARGLHEVSGTKGRAVYRRSRVDPQDLHLVTAPLDYSSYERALADGVLSVDDYLNRIEFHAERGDLTEDLAQIVQGRRDGTLAPRGTLERDYRREVTKLGLRSVGRGAFTYPEWQQSFIDAVIRRHGERAIGESSAPVVVDAMTGITPDVGGPEIGISDFKLSKGASVRPEADELYRYVDANLDDLLKPRNVLHAYVNPNGKLELAVATYGGSPTTKVKPTGGLRLKLKGVEGKERAMLGADRIEVQVKNGDDLHRVRFHAAFEGAEGGRFMAQVSSRGPQDAWASQVADTDYARLINQSASSVDVDPTQPHYATSWERAVNVQLYNDQVARQFMDGKSVDDVLNWMRNSPDGRKYWGRLGPWQSRPVEQVYAIKAMVDTYLPLPEDAAARHGAAVHAQGGAVSDVEAGAIAGGGDAFTAAQDLRRAALEGKAEFNQFDKLFPSKQDMPAIHGASLDVTVGGPFMNAVKKGVDKIFRVLSDMPADKASRFPFFAERYQDHLREIVPRYIEQQGVGEVLSVDDMARIETHARERALADVKKYLYDTSAALDLAKAGGLLVPFSSAVGDSLLKWGMIAREQGVIPPMLNIWKIWTAPDKAGLVQDEDGNVKRWNPETQQYDWYQRVPVKQDDGSIKWTEKKLDGHDPKQEYIVFRLPAGVAPKTSSGEVMPTYINKETFNTFLGLPTAGPLVAYPANEFELKNPKAADNWFMRKFVLPFGPTSDHYKAFLPSNVRSTYNTLTDNEQNRRGIAQAVMQTEYVNYALGKRSKPPTMEEVNQTATDLSALQFMSVAFGLSSQYKSPYQPYLDYYRQLQQQDPENATARFYAEMGDEYRMMTASVSRNVAGLPASIETANAQKKYQDLIAKYPDMAPLIVGAEGAGSFSQAVYQAQLEQSLQPGSNDKMRQVLSLQDSVEDAERKYVWVKYSKLMDAIEADMAERGLTSLTQKRAKDLKATRDKFIEEHKYWTNPQGAQDVNPWFVEYSTTDRAKMTERLTAMANLVTDDRLGQRDDMRGLYEYLDARIQVRDEMQRRKFATLDTKKASKLNSQWQAYVTGLKEKNLSFAQLYNRWLVNDDMTADIIFQGGGE